MSETVTLYKCSSCGKVILKPEDGLVVHGNIYAADPNNRTTLIGNNFPTRVDDEITNELGLHHAIESSAFCVPCFLNAALPNVKLSAVRDFKI